MPSARVWIDGTFGVCNFDRQFTLDLPDIKPVQEGHRTFIAAQIEAHGIEEVLAACAETRAWRENLRALHGDEQSESLGLSIAPNSPKKKRGLNGITVYGRLLVRNAAFFLENTCARDTLSFLTVTLPSVDLETNRYLCSVWERIVKNFVKALKRDLQGCGLSGEIVGVTEIQEKRYTTTAGFVGLHLHLLFQGRSRGKAWVIKTERCDELWENAICSVSEGLRGRLSFDASCRIERVEKSAANYLGKYMSKGAPTIKKLQLSKAPVELPATWYSCTLSLRSKVKNLQVVGDRPAKLINEWIDRNRVDMFDRLNKIEIDLSEGGTLQVGWAGRLSEKGRKALGLAFTSGYRGRESLSL